MFVVSPEIWTVRRLVDGITAQRIPAAAVEHPDPDAVVGFLESIASRAPLGCLVLAEVFSTGGHVEYAVIDGRFRLEVIARVFTPEQYASDEAWHAHLRPPAQGGGMGWGVSQDPAAMPLHVICSTLKFMGWEGRLHGGEPDADRARAALDSAHQASRMLETPILVYVVRGADADTRDGLRAEANARLNARLDAR